MKSKKLMSMIGLIIFTVLQLNGQQENLLQLDQSWLNSKKEVFADEASKPQLLLHSAKDSNLGFGTPLLKMGKEEFKKQRIKSQGQRRFHALPGQLNENGMSPMPKAMIDESMNYHLLIKKVE